MAGTIARATVGRVLRPIAGAPRVQEERARDAAVVPAAGGVERILLERLDVEARARERRDDLPEPRRRRRRSSRRASGAARRRTRDAGWSSKTRSSPCARSARGDAGAPTRRGRRAARARPRASRRGRTGRGASFAGSACASACDPEDASASARAPRRAALRPASIAVTTAPSSASSALASPDAAVQVQDALPRQVAERLLDDRRQAVRGPRRCRRWASSNIAPVVVGRLHLRPGARSRRRRRASGRRSSRRRRSRGRRRRPRRRPARRAGRPACASTVREHLVLVREVLERARLDDAGRDGVHADPARRELDAEVADDRLERRLRRRR